MKYITLKGPLPIRKDIKINAMMKDKLDGEIMKIFVGLSPKRNHYKKDNDTKKRLKEPRKKVINVKSNLEILRIV